MLQRMTEKCFKKCIGKPGSTLDNSEQVCRDVHVEVCFQMQNYLYYVLSKRVYRFTVLQIYCLLLNVKIHCFS